jgi:SAM-dependent methyltransferase
MGAAMERLVSEQAFHDRQAAIRSATFDLHPDRLHVDDDAYLDHETWIRPAFSALGDVRGLRVLDLGCGHAMASIVMARRGAEVAAIELSAAYLAEARRRAASNNVRLHLVQANGERLPFPDGCFDRIWANAVLHHLDLSIAAVELRRVLHPAGVAVFCEPWGENPVLNAARRWLAYPGKGRTPDEQPLTERGLNELKRAFCPLRVRGYQLLNMLRRAMPTGRLSRALQSCDAAALRWCPPLRRMCRYVVIEAGAGLAKKRGQDL